VTSFAFVRRPPERVGELAAALGLTVGDIFADGRSDMGHVMHDRFSATYDWDMYHEDRVRSADDLGRRSLQDYCVFCDGGRDECEAALRALHGEPQPVGERTRYGPFFLSRGVGGRFNLEWYATEPDWAMPPADPEQRLAELRALVADGGYLALEPPMPAIECAGALGRPDAIGVSTDVHMSHWVLAEPDGERLRIGGRAVEATIGGWPSGPEVSGVSIPAGAAHHLGDDDVVRWVRIEE
jgi:hypothetical protein